MFLLLVKEVGYSVSFGFVADSPELNIPFRYCKYKKNMEISGPFIWNEIFNANRYCKPGSDCKACEVTVCMVYLIYCKGVMASIDTIDRPVTN